MVEEVGYTVIVPHFRKGEIARERRKTKLLRLKKQREQGSGRREKI